MAKKKPSEAQLAARKRAWGIFQLKGMIQVAKDNNWKYLAEAAQQELDRFNGLR